jgi:protein-S-isoprenylcysteine O-methyltransferase Ste14
MRDTLHTVFVVGMVLMVGLRLYWHVRAGTARDRAAVRAGIAREGGFGRMRWMVGPASGVVLLLYLLAPGTMRWSELPLPVAAGWLGTGLFGLGFLLLAWVHTALGRNFNTTLVVRPDHELVVHGPYRYVRHPMYSAFILLFGGMFLLTSSVVIGVLSAVAMYGLLVVRMPREEAQLAERFGARYEAYRSSTGMLVPRLARR